MRQGSGLRGPVVVIGLLLVLGTAGYMLIEGWPFLDALYMTVATLVTVGFGEIHPLSTAGRIFTIGLIMLGVGGVLYTFTSVMQYVFEGHLGRERELRRHRPAPEGFRHRRTLALVGRTLAEIQEQVAHGVTVLAICRDSRLVTQPALTTDVRLGDELVVFGTPQQRPALEGVA